MKTWLHSLRQKLHHYRVAIGVTAIILVVVIALILAGYWFDWTGFNGYNKVTITHIISGTNVGTSTRTEEYQPRKALWDWLQLLIIPLVLAIAALLFNLATTRTEQNIAAKRYEQDQKIAAKRYEQDQDIAAKRYEQDQKIALDKQREGLLQIYLDRMSELLLKEKLSSSEAGPEARNVARVRTITILFQLDARRIGYVFAFLRESGLMSTKPNSSIVSLNQADLKKINFSQADLSRADLIEADLNGAYLNGAYLNGAYLNGAYLSGANLEGISGITIEELEEKAKTLQDAFMFDGSKHS
ncbi:MAG: pentapeptide repeat-containing protein [Ktedonobacteraceae bacterium]